MSFGEEIKRERKLREISLREVSESTKISLRYLEALEGNDFENLPGGVFNRGFVRAYSQFIGVDPDAMVDSYLLEERAAGIDSSTKHEEGKPSRKGLWIGLTVVALGLIGALVWYFFWGRG